MEIPEDSDFSRLTCSSCGGSFSLVGERTVTHQGAKARTLGHFELISTASSDRTVKIWDAATGKEWLTLLGHTVQVISVSWSPDGGRLASASIDGTVKIWDAATGGETLTLRGHTDRVWSVS